MIQDKYVHLRLRKNEKMFLVYLENAADVSIVAALSADEAKEFVKSLSLVKVPVNRVEETDRDYSFSELRELLKEEKRRITKEI